MKIHHLKCGCMCPIGGGLFKRWVPREVICHCLLLETNDRLILVDTGLGLRDIENPKRLGLSSTFLGVQNQKQWTAVEQVKQLGFSPKDVTDLIPTHLDLDHAGGISDFKWAHVHVAKPELEAALSRRNFRFRERYRPCQLEADTKWAPYELGGGERWLGFQSAKAVNGLPADILLVDLPGHTPGHVGIAVAVDHGWVLHAGDAYFDRRELVSATRREAPPALRFYERLAHTHYAQALGTQKDLQAISSKIKMFCSHDPSELPAPSQVKAI